MALPTKVLEVALEKGEATREKLLEMAMPFMQRKRLERLDMFDMRLGMELIKQCSGDSSEPADIDPGREPRHGDAAWQPVLDGAETDRSLSSNNNAYPESRANASKKGGRRSGQDVNGSETKNEGDDGGSGAGQQRGRNREEKGGASYRSGNGCDDATGAPKQREQESMLERAQEEAL